MRLPGMLRKKLASEPRNNFPPALKLQEGGGGSIRHSSQSRAER
jgi:hypothetical protein